MKFTETTIKGLIIIEPAVFEDSRGAFFEAYNERAFKQNKINCLFVQDNQSSSTKGVIRGLHYQQAPFAQSKLVRVLHGTILDIAVDIRKASPTYGAHLAVELSSENKKQLFIPAGFAHGFSVLSSTAIVLYKCNHFYSKESEGGFCYNDPDLNINWKVDAGEVIVSDKDVILPLFKNFSSPF